MKKLIRNLDKIKNGLIKGEYFDSLNTIYHEDENNFSTDYFYFWVLGIKNDKEKLSMVVIRNLDFKHPEVGDLNSTMTIAEAIEDLYDNYFINTIKIK